MAFRAPPPNPVQFNTQYMPWFTNEAASCGTSTNPSVNACLATQFAAAVGTQLDAGAPAPIRFAFSGMTSNSVGSGISGTPCTGSSCLRTGQFISTRNEIITLDTEPQNGNARWAYAEEVPGPLPVLGAAAAFGFSRKLRKRINDSKADGSSFPAA